MALGKDYGGGGHAARARRVHVLHCARSPNTRATRDAAGPVHISVASLGRT